MIWPLPHTFCRETVYVSNFAWNFDKLHKRRVSAPITVQKTCFCTNYSGVAEKKSRRNWDHMSKDYISAKWFDICPQHFAENCLCQQFCMKFRQIAQKTCFTQIILQKTCFCTINFGVARKKSRRNWNHMSKDYISAKWFDFCPTHFAEKLFMSEILHEISTNCTKDMF